MPQADLPGSGPGPAAARTTLVPFSFWSNGAGVDRLAAAMAEHFAELGLSQAEPLRWAITAVDPQQGLQLEGIVLAAAPAAVGAEPKPAA